MDRGWTLAHCAVKWSGDELEWFDRPYFVVPWLEGDVIRIAPGEWADRLTLVERLDLGRQAMNALAAIHRVSPAAVTYLGDPLPFVEDVTRWGCSMVTFTSVTCFAVLMLICWRSSTGNSVVLAQRRMMWVGLPPSAIRKRGHFAMVMDQVVAPCFLIPTR